MVRKCGTKAAEAAVPERDRDEILSGARMIRETERWWDGLRPGADGCYSHGCEVRVTKR